MNRIQPDPAEHPIVQVARDLQPLIAECADETEANGRPPDHLIETFTDAGLFRLFIPAAAGGLEVPPLVTFHTVEALSEADPSSGWVVMLAAELSLVTGFLDTEHLREMIGSDDPGGPRCRIAGSARPTNWGKRAEGGWIINGIATYASGIDHATQVVAAFRDEDQPADSYMSFLDPDQGTILRTWDTMGLRGTGSHDYESANVFAPDRRTMKIGSRPVAKGPNWRIPDSGIASWLQNGGQALGAAQGAINEVVGQAKYVASKSDSRSLAEREHFRVALGRAQARVGSARSYVREMGSIAWQSVLDGAPNLDAVAQWRLANVNAVHAATEAVEMLFPAAGTNAIHRRWTLERRFRDLQVARRHNAGLDFNWDAGTRHMLGMPALTRGAAIPDRDRYQSGPTNA